MRLPRRFPRRFRYLAEVLLGHLMVMFGGHGLTVADPVAGDVQGIGLGQLCLAGGAKILEQLRSGCQPGPLRTGLIDLPTRSGHIEGGGWR